MPTDERVLCIPESHFASVGRFHGFRPADAAYKKALLDPAVFEFHARSQVETDPSFKQLIPYVVLKAGEQIFHYRRGASGTEKRLQALRSIGIGGHISESDTGQGDDVYWIGMLRELDEEVEITGEVQVSDLGWIYDDRTLVGSVHLGVVHLFELLGPPLVQPREAAISEASFAPRDQLFAERDGFESWSQLVLEELSRR